MRPSSLLLTIYWVESCSSLPLKKVHEITYIPDSKTISRFAVTSDDLIVEDNHRSRGWWHDWDVPIAILKSKFNSKTASTKWYTLILIKEKKLYFQNLLNTFSAKLLILQLNDSSLIFQIFFSKGSSQFFRMH